ncbi:bifunctional 23S rRNA (guanine(2069)-N(7))-methyltransferase RlmK/23S rRNA (guanine(2445)-N(2))-methyltransferase RlmL [Thalassotalea ponticola]|uniref:bifunctional 23S rRNA (guanine(2069)-N(7))-methyltransferase RlmK/23S rRNA (guanine(2445)-N(2))-methyltransferase RlmL n=1 Tax=Thalassotalea ponticola TaxID=1523392 RepID=UPI0025B2F0C6|nr:bifunctional 23S rRNA (guanine(2069)-N(7))-methyltransferase RlmK/23S rRNA (guanine(2445)-N(2))-methyltransferase RlmL [Thalassotalea ponticola]MDN3653100.1 bifunctional 23S rRNA (guanine(2069)-N(7))-methyltransferase RlmK/23S rRNA (guanine(2445)-N(2))-methyltransferase RlmL [Thalassotalea ponticola]
MNQFLALTSFGIEQLLADELKQLDASDVVQKPEGVYFSSTLENAYLICLRTRLASRVLLAISEPVPIKNKDDLYNAASAITWPNHFSAEKSFAVDFVGKNQAIRDSQFGALTVKDAIVDSFRDQGQVRPNVEKFQPDVRFQARLLRNAVTFYLDFSGRSLFARGYRDNTGAAPIKENLAAAMVIRSGWLNDINQPLIDPMCGSGTLLIEAISMAAGLSPGVDRKYWGFEGWQQHDAELFNSLLESEGQANQQRLTDCDIKVYGFDSDQRVLKTARINAKNAELSDFIEFKPGRAENLVNPFKATGHILFNPPYGERLGSLPELVSTFTELGKLFKQRFLGWHVALITSNIEMLALLKLASHKRYKFKNGPLDCQMALYHIDQAQIERTPEVSISDKDDNAFANRLRKNIKTMKSWLKQHNVNCYRIYDADIPEYNVAVDIYDDHLVIFEYAPPKSIDAKKASERLQEVIYFAPRVLDVSADKVVVKVRAKQKGKNQYQALNKAKKTLVVREYNALLKVNLWDYLDTGLFLDHRKTRQLVAKKSKGKRVLNLFAYTGSVSVQAALAGAEAVTTVDMSKTYLEWAKDNFELNGLRGHKYQFIQADCLAWLAENNQQFDLVFIDPPTFSNSKRMTNTFDVQRDHIETLVMAMKAVAPGGELIFTNNKRNFKMDFDALAAHGLQAKELSAQTLDIDFKRNKHIHNSWSITRQ